MLFLRSSVTFLELIISLSHSVKSLNSSSSFLFCYLMPRQVFDLLKLATSSTVLFWDGGTIRDLFPLISHWDREFWLGLLLLSSIRGSLTFVYLLPALLKFGSLAFTWVPLKIGGANGLRAAFAKFYCELSLSKWEAKSPFCSIMDLMGRDTLEF